MTEMESSLDIRLVNNPVRVESPLDPSTASPAENPSSLTPLPSTGPLATLANDLIPMLQQPLTPPAVQSMTREGFLATFNAFCASHGYCYKVNVKLL